MVQAAHFVNLFFGGLLAGIEIAVHYGIVEPVESVDERSQLLYRQLLVRRLRILVPACFLPTLISGIAVIVVDGIGTGFWLRCAAMAALVLWIAVRLITTIRINSATLEWNVDNPPHDRRALVDRSERFHVLGVLAAIVSFAAFLAETLFFVFQQRL